MSFLKITNLTISTSSKILLKPVFLELALGSRLTIVGESGAGKSILIQAIMGVLPKSLKLDGNITIDKLDTNGQYNLTKRLWGNKICMLPQEPWLALNPLMKMRDQVAESARFAQNIQWAGAYTKADAYLERLNLSSSHSLRLHQISGGMAQRVGVAASSVGGAQLLLADEPTKGLDSESCAQVANLLKSMQADGQALLTITHDLKLARELGGQLIVMHQGSIVESGDAEQIFNHPQQVYTRLLIDAQPFKWKSLVADSPVSSDEVVIQAKGLSKSYADKTLFKDFSLKIKKGEAVSLSGNSGSGKTTLGNLLLGLHQPDSGSVSRAPALAFKFGKLYQDPPAAFAASLTIRQALQHLIELHQLNGKKNTPSIWTEIIALLTELNLSDALLDRLPNEVSGGELQRLCLLRLLIIQPVFIFADEPTSRLDAITQQLTMKLLIKATQQSNCALLLVSHDADLAQACSHTHIRL